MTHELRRMNLYGVLGRYIPAFGRVVGRMQYDLFHAYTVDAHILFVLRNLRRLVLPRFDHELPEMSRLMQQSIQRHEVAYLAALFHDIAKGRGGDHSELGSVDAEAFCLEQGLSRYDAKLVAWLVRNHLLFSVTAQKKDTSDPKVIQEFARLVGDQTHLDHLYLLTVADVRGTNPKLWNSWKASLFHDFYERVRRVLRRGLETPLEHEELVAETKAHALELLDLEHVARERAAQIWSRFNEMYFLRYTPAEVAWHTKLLAATEPDDLSLMVAVRTEVERGGNAVLTVRPASPAELRPHRRAARPDGPQHRRRAHHAARRRPGPGYVPGARGHRPADRRPASCPPDRAAAAPRAAEPRDGAAGRHAARAAAGAHVRDADADHLHR